MENDFLLSSNDSIVEERRKEYILEFGLCLVGELLPHIR